MGKLLDDYNAYMRLQELIKYQRIVLPSGTVDHRPKRKKHKKAKVYPSKDFKALDRDFKRRIEREE